MSKDKDKKRRQRQAQWEKEKAQIEEHRQKAPDVKRALRKVGCDLPFYDFLDSYEEQFARIVTWGKTQFPSLLDAHEVDEGDFRNTDWKKFGCASERQIFFDIDDRLSTYGKANGKANKQEANLQGSATFFRDGENSFKSVVLILKNPPTKTVHKELKYPLKIASVLHELGHVHDAEHRTNIDPPARRFDVIEAEAYANCFCLDRLSERCLYYAYEMLYEAMQTLASGHGYEAEIGQKVIERHERKNIPHWQDYMDTVNASP